MLALLVPSVARAAPLTAVTPGDGFVAVSAGKLAWIDASSKTTLRVHEWSLAGGAIATLYSQDAPLRGDELDAGGVAISPTRVAFGATESVLGDAEGSLAYSVVRTAPPGGAFAITAGDLQGKTFVGYWDLDGDILATNENGKALVRDLAAGGAPRQFGPADATGVQVAGPYVAVGLPWKQASRTIVVFDRMTRAEVYRVTVPVPPTPYEYLTHFAFDLEADGTLAISASNPRSTGARPRDNLAWASIAEPRLHVVATDIDTEVLRIADNRILFARDHPPASTEVAVADLAGAITPASFPVDVLVDADFDGRHVAFSTPWCVYAGDLPDAQAAAAPPVGTCPQMRVQVDDVGTPSSKSAHVRVQCLQASVTGCAGTVVLRTRPAKGRKTLTVGMQMFSLSLGEARVLTFKISAKMLRSIRARMSHKLKIGYLGARADAIDAAGLNAATWYYERIRVRLRP